MIDLDIKERFIYCFQCKAPFRSYDDKACFRCGSTNIKFDDEKNMEFKF